MALVIGGTRIYQRFAYAVEHKVGIVVGIDALLCCGSHDNAFDFIDTGRRIGCGLNFIGRVGDYIHLFTLLSSRWSHIARCGRIERNRGCIRGKVRTLSLVDFTGIVGKQVRKNPRKAVLVFIHLVADRTGVTLANDTVTFRLPWLPRRLLLAAGSQRHLSQTKNQPAHNVSKFHTLLF